MSYGYGDTLPDYRLEPPDGLDLTVMRATVACECGAEYWEGACAQDVIDGACAAGWYVADEPEIDMDDEITGLCPECREEW